MGMRLQLCMPVIGGGGLLLYIPRDEATDVHAWECGYVHAWE